jgi:hypothetical protein
MLISLIAPRPVFIVGGVGDQWSDPRGEFLGEVAAGPVYTLLGEKDLGTTHFPNVDTPVITGSLGYLYHSGAHTMPATDWFAALEFADQNLKNSAPNSERMPSQATTTGDLQKLNDAAIQANLHELFTAAQQYLLDMGVKSVSYSDLNVYRGHSFNSNKPIEGEDYSTLIFTQNQTEISIKLPDGREIKYSQ